MKCNNYNSERVIDCLYNRGYTNFLNRKEFQIIKKQLKSCEYNVYELYKESSKIILYNKKIPDIAILKIDCNNKLKHQSIMGTIYSLGLNDDVFGDIIYYEDSFYIFVLPIIKNYLIQNMLMVEKNKVNLREVDLSISLNFKINYEVKNYIVSSLRIDNIISSIIGDSRNGVLDKFKNKEIIINYNENIKPSYTLKENDIFSIKKYGKYKFKGIVKTTKKSSLIIEVLKYI